MRFRCHKCRSSRKRCVWLVDHRTYCNACFDRIMESLYDVLEHSVHRLTDNERFFEDAPRARKQTVTRTVIAIAAR